MRRVDETTQQAVLLTGRQKIEGCMAYQSGDPFLISRLAHTACISIEEATDIVSDMIAQGLIAKFPETEGRAGPRTSYYRVSRASMLLRRPWTRQSFASMAWL